MSKKQTNILYNIDSRNIGSILPNKSLIQTTITSPPYFDMKDYGVENQIGFGQTYEKYLDDLQCIFKDILNRTKDNGTLWIVIDTFKRNHSVVPLPFDLANKLKEVGWIFQDIIIWKKDKTVPWSSDGFVQRKIEYILFFSKRTKFKYNKDVTRVYDTQMLKRWWVKYPERYNPKGKALDEIWEYPIPVQGAWGDKYIRHFCPLPKEMVATMISLSTDENDIILDPFAGSGAVLSQAAYMRRKYIGVELNGNYIKQFESYLNETLTNGQKEYTMIKASPDQSSFETVIWQLRALKYGRVLLNAIEKQMNTRNGKVVVTPLQMQNDKMSVEYIFIIDENLQPKYAELIPEIIKKKPLSLYGIIPTIKYDEPKNHDITLYYKYSSTNSHSYIKQSELFSKAKVYSNIKIDINEQQYV
ncbi:MAG: site-specific DNA-methyltransferase [Bacteroidales bacterium]|nr:site-specific DNA-methyltransferase [Bacteroidales bacterium]